MGNIKDILLSLMLFTIVAFAIVSCPASYGAVVTYKKPTVRLATKVYTTEMIYPYAMEAMPDLETCKKKVMKLAMEAFDNIDTADGVVRAEYSCMSTNYGISVEK